MLKNSIDRIKSITSHFFIPQKSNNFRAKILHLDFLTAIIIFSLAFNLIVSKVRNSNVLGYATDITKQKLLELTNKERTSRGLSPLSNNSKLEHAASLKATHMFTHNYWAHYAPDGTAPWEFILKSGYDYEYAGENLAKNFLFSSDVVRAWMNSPTHRANILKSEYTDIGFAIKNGMLQGEETTLVVQMFGRPLKPLLAQNKTTTPTSSITKSPTSTKKATQTTPSPTSKPITVNKTTPANPQQNTKTNTTIKTLTKPRVSTVLGLASITSKIDFTLLFILIAVITVDFAVALKFNMIRVTGKNMAHFLFLSFILIGLSIIIKGAIV